MKQRLSLNLDFITVPSTVAGPLSALVREGIDSAPFMGSDVIKNGVFRNTIRFHCVLVIYVCYIHCSFTSTYSSQLYIFPFPVDHMLDKICVGCVLSIPSMVSAG